MQPTRITSHSNTLIDNIFSIVIEPDIISGNLTATISDHMHQFAIIPNIFGNISQAINIIFMKGTGQNLIKKISFLAIFLDWEDLLKIDKLNADSSKKNKKTLWPFFMDGIQLPQGYRATSRRQFTFYH